MKKAPCYKGGGKVKDGSAKSKASTSSNDTLGTKVSNVSPNYKFDRSVGNKQVYIDQGNISAAKKGANINNSQDAKKYNNFIINKLKSGLSPDELIKQGYATKDGIAPLVNNYNPKYVHVESPVENNVDNSFQPYSGTRSGETLLPKNSANQDWNTYRFADLNGQTNQSVDRHFSDDGNEIYFDSNGNRSQTGKNLDFYRNSNVRSDAQGSTLVPNSVTNVGPVITNDPDKFNTLGSSTSQGFAKGGKVKGYATGGSTSYNERFQTVNALNQQQNNPNVPKQNSGQGQAIANQGGKLLGAYGTGYYATQAPENSADATRNAAMGAVSQAGPVGGVIGGVAAIGDKIGKPIKAKSERLDEEGNLVNANKAQKNAIIGGLFSPSKALAARSQYKGGWTDISGKGYLQHLEKEGKEAINLERQAAIDEEKQAAYEAAKENANEALLNRNAGLTDVGDNYYRKAVELDPLLDVNDSSVKRKNKFFANGGLVKGAGTAKSDSISAKVVPGSFVVPAENVPVIEEIKEKVLKVAPKKKANLNQKGGKEVKLSNGEYLLTPDEKIELETKGINVNALAPNSDDINDKMILSNAQIVQRALESNYEGLTGPDKKRVESMENSKEFYKYLKDKDPDNVRIRYFKDPEEKSVYGYKKGGEVTDPPTNKKAAQMMADKRAQDIKRRDELLITQAKLQEALKNPNDKNRYYNESALKGVTESINAYNERYGTPETKTKEAAKTVANISYSGSASTTKKAPSKVGKATVTADVLKPTSIDKLPTEEFKGPFVDPYEKGLYNERTPSEIERMAQQPEEVTLDTPDIINPTVPLANQTPVPTNTNGVPTGKKKFDYDNILGNAINYGIPIAQTAIGLKQLKKAGSRPVDKLDADYIDSLTETKKGVDQANINARYGFTGAEKTALDQQNAQLTNAGRYAARNFSGGSSANALNMERSVINDSFGRALNTKISDNALKMDKQQQAFQRQQALNSQIQDKQDRLRQFFGDDLNAFHQKTQSASGLVNTGLSNAIEAYRADQRLKNFNTKMGQTNNFNQPII